MTTNHDNTIPVLLTDSKERKEIPIFSGFLNYFPLAIAAVARHSKRGNDKHNPGEPIHWARGKSMDHVDCIGRHLLDIDTVNAAGEYEDLTCLVWRGLAELQMREEARLGKPVSRGSKVSVPEAKPEQRIRLWMQFDNGSGAWSDMFPELFDSEDEARAAVAAARMVWCYEGRRVSP